MGLKHEEACLVIRNDNCDAALYWAKDYDRSVTFSLNPAFNRDSEGRRKDLLERASKTLVADGYLLALDEETEEVDWTPDPARPNVMFLRVASRKSS